MTDVVTAASTPQFRSRRRRAILSAWAGFGMDSYSIYIATSALLPALIYFQGPHMSDGGKSIFAGMTLASTLCGRPLGGLIFGHFADRMSRRNTGTITIVGFATMSLLIACLPGAQQVGTGVAVTLLLLLRFVEGIFLGGEYTAATPMALEYAPPRRRGLVAATIQCAAHGGPFVVAVLMTAVLAIAPSHGLHSPYVQWGWRIPFVVGAVFALLVAWFLRRKVEDSEIWKEANATKSRTRSPLLELLKGNAGRAFIQAWFIMGGIFFVSNVVTSVGNQFLLKNTGFSANDLAHTQLITPIPAMFAYIFIGWLSDYIGRKNGLYIGAIVALLVVPASITAIGSKHVHQWYQLTLLAVAANICLGLLFGMLPSYINERFATSVRSSGWGVAYGTAVVIPSFFSYYMVWLSHLMPFLYTAATLAVLGVVIILIATACGPETKGIDLADAGQPRRSTTVNTAGRPAHEDVPGSSSPLAPQPPVITNA